MKKTALLILILLVLSALGWTAVKMLGFFPSDVQPAEFGTPLPVSTDLQPIKLQLEVVADNLFVPWSLVFTSPDRMLISERNGNIRQWFRGELAADPVYTFENVPQNGEEGLMSLVLDPAYATTRWIYAALAYDTGDGLAVRVVRLTDEGSVLSEPRTIIENIPAARFHAGTDLRFGPDGKLYISTGDATDRNLAQDMSSLAGKILRLNADGSIPSDNPFPNSAIYSLGHRNPQGLAFQPGTGRLYSTEHGPSVFDGPAGGDEVNLITAGANYGWPTVSHQREQAGLVSPLYVYTPAVAPGSAEFYASEVIPQFNGHFFFGALVGTALYDLTIDPSNPQRILSSTKVPDIDVGRIRDVVAGPDGFLYFTTSNRDGRGRARDNDDKVYRLRPVE